MASFKMTGNQAFPSGATVTAYPASNWGYGQTPPSGAPVGTATASATADNNGVIINGLTPGIRYYAYAAVDGQHRYVAIRIAEASGKLTFSAPVAAALLGDNTVVAAQAGKSIRVHGYVLVAAGAVTAKWRSGVDDVTGGMPFAANGGLSVPGEEDRMLFETAPGAALNLNLSAAVAVGGHVQYAVEG